MKINFETLNVGLALIGITFLSILAGLYIICVLLILSLGPIYLATVLSNWFYILYLMDIPLIILIIWGLWKLINMTEEFMD